MTPVDAYALPTSPWKNGGGATRTLAVSPPDATLDNFDWRISIADVTTSGDFSIFPGFDRIILLLDGPGMSLNNVPLTTPFLPHSFSGNDPVTSQLLGPSRDFNVMTRRGRATADLKLLRSDAQLTADTAVFFAARGTSRINAAELKSGWVLQVDRPGSTINVQPQTPDALTIAVLITTLETS